MFLTVIGTMKNLGYFFDIPTDKSVVIKKWNRFFPKRKVYQKGEPIKINSSLYTMAWFECFIKSHARDN